MNVFNSIYRLAARPAVMAVVVSALVASESLAAPVTIQPDAALAQDVFVYQGMPTWNLDSMGFEKLLVVGKSSAGHDLQSLIKFDLTGVALGAGEKATLNLYVDSTETAGFPAVSPSATGVVLVDVAAASSAWTASTTTWNTGITGGATAAGFSVDHTGYWASVDVTSLVEAWLATPSSNNGFFLTQDAAVNSGGWVNVVFQASAGTNKPYLQISSVPEPTLVAGGAVVAGLLLRRRRA
ncbi:MAG: DNRLRE domain-containing protein [Tepidisphaeraceae bacterium]